MYLHVRSIVMFVSAVQWLNVGVNCYLSSSHRSSFNFAASLALYYTLRDNG